MSDILIYKEQIEDVFVLKSVYELDMLNKVDIDGNLSIGGIWWQDQVLTDRFSGNKQVWTAFSNNTLEIGNVDLNKVILTANGINSFKAKVGTVEYTMYHSGNLNLDIYALTDGSNAEGDLATTIENSHTHGNKAIIDSITAQDLINWDDAVELMHNHANKSVLDGITAIKISNWDSTFASSHSHTNKALLDSYNQSNADITDAVNKRHTHTNKAILDAITAAFTTADDNLLNALGGLQFESDQTNAVLRIKDGNGSVLTSISLAYLNNEGTKFSYNATNNTLDLLNDAGQVLSSIPVSSFVTNLVKSANWNGSTPYRLDFKDNAGTILFSIDYTINNIQGLQGTLDNKVSKSGDVMNGDLGLSDNVKFKFKAPSDPTHYIWNDPTTDFDEINVSVGFQIIDYATGLPLFSTQNGFNQSFRNLIVPAGIADAHAVNLGQLNNALADIPETILANKVGFIHLNQNNSVTNEAYYNNEAPLNIQFQDTETVKITATTDGVNTKYRFDSDTSFITHDDPLDNYLAGGGNNSVKVICHIMNENIFQSPTDGNVLVNDAISLVGLWDDYIDKAVLRGEVQVNTSLQSYINAGKRYLVYYGEINSLGTQIDYQDCDFYTLIEIANMKLAVGEKNFIVKVGEIMDAGKIYVNPDLM